MRVSCLPGSVLRVLLLFVLKLFERPSNLDASIQFGLLFLLALLNPVRRSIMACMIVLCLNCIVLEIN